MKMPVERNSILLGDCKEWLKKFPDNTFTAVVTDPPYGLSEHDTESVTRALRSWLGGAEYTHDKAGFMNRTWDSFVPGPEIWREVMRVLKPGGHIMSFSGTRSYDLMVTAMRIAGAEIRDQINYYCELQGSLDWVYGQGFPKSLNISKAIDKAAGVEREVIGPNKFEAINGEENAEVYGEASRAPETAPATEEAKKWEGYGTALKPAHEPVAVFGKSDDSGNLTDVDADVPFYYEGKSASRERDYGCKPLFWKHNDTDYQRISKQEYLQLDAENKKRKDEPGFVPHRIAHGNVWPCLHPDSFILTSEGMMRIGSVEVGDFVYSHDGRYHRVSDKFNKPCSVLYRIAVKGCNAEVLASNNHPFLVYRPKRTKKGSIVSYEVMWVEAENIRVGDYTMTPISRMGRSPAYDNPDFWFVMGLWLAEGAIQKAGHGSNVYPSWSLNANEKHLEARIRKVSTRRVSAYPKGGGMTVMMFDPVFASRCLDICGRYSHGKRISEEVFMLPLHLRKAFLEGYLAGDGSVDKNSLRAKTVSERLFYQLKILGESVGYYVSCSRYQSKKGKIGNRVFKNILPEWRIIFTEKNVCLTGKRRTKPTVVEHEGTVYTLQYVKKSDRVDYDGEVVNLTVEGSQTFQTSIGMSHNTVKPIELCRYLVKMLKMPGDNLVLDPFCGSGSTLIGCILEGCDYIGIDMDPIAYDIAQTRAHYFRCLGKKGIRK